MIINNLKKCIPKVSPRISVLAQLTLDGMPGHMLGVLHGILELLLARRAVPILLVPLQYSGGGLLGGMYWRVPVPVDLVLAG